MTETNEILKTIQAFKDVRVRGCQVIAVPLNPAELESIEKKADGFGIAEKPTAEEGIRLVAVAVGSGGYQNGILIPLDFSVGDIFIPSWTNESVRNLWKESKTLLNGFKVLFCEARFSTDSQAGAVYAIVGHVGEN